MKFLKFTDRAAFEQAFAEYLYSDGNGGLIAPSYIGDVAIDVVGVIPVESGDFRTIEIAPGHSIQIPIMVPSEGYHVNLSGPLTQFEAFEVQAPATPYRVFAGWSATPEPARVPPIIPRWAAVLSLKSNPSTLIPGATLWEAVVAVRNEILTKPDGETISMGGVVVPISTELKNRVIAALDDANYWERSSEMVNLVAMAIGLDKEAVDKLFVWAGSQQM